MINNSENKITRCDDCEYFNYDEYLECYICTQNLDEDDYYHLFYNGTTAECQYYKKYDEYNLVKKQN